MNKTTIDEKQLQEQRSIDNWMAINTVFTIIAGVSNIILMLVGLYLTLRK